MRYVIDPDRSKVWIDGSSSVHPIRASATGLTGRFEAALEGVVVTGPVAGRVEIAVDRLRSGNPLVDRETRRRVDARRYPLIVGEVTALDDVDGERVDVRGRISFRGTDRDVAGDLVVTPTTDGVRIEGEQTFDVRDWGLDPPKLLTVRVHPEVTVRIVIEAEQRDI